MASLNLLALKLGCEFLHAALPVTIEAHENLIVPGRRSRPRRTYTTGSTSSFLGRISVIRYCFFSLRVSNYGLFTVPVQDVTLAALYVSSKMHDTLKKPREILMASYAVRFPEQAAKSKSIVGEIDMDPAVRRDTASSMSH